jgi:hypothetical protein
MKKLLPVIALFIFACDNIKEVRNNPEHIQEGKEIASKFYSFVKSQNYKESLKYIDLASLSEKEAHEKFHITDSLLGKIVSLEFKSGESYIKTVNNKTLEYKIKTEYAVVYERGKATDILQFQQKNDSLKIVYYSTKVNF